MSRETFSVVVQFRRYVQKSGGFLGSVFVVAMDSDAERAPDLPECISDGHDYRAVDAGRPRSGLYIAGRVRLNIAA